MFRPFAWFYRSTKWYNSTLWRQSTTQISVRTLWVSNPAGSQKDQQESWNSSCGWLSPSRCRSVICISQIICILTNSSLYLVLHPLIHLTYFQNLTWDPSVAQCARTLLEHLYKTYRADGPSAKATASKSPSEFDSIFMNAILSMTPDQQQVLVTDLEAYFNGTCPCPDGNVLKWWKVCIAAPPYFISLISIAATCRRVSYTLSHCPRYSCHSWCQYICWTVVLEQQAYTIWLAIFYDGFICIQDSGCQRMVEARSRKRCGISRWPTNPPLSMVKYEYDTITIWIQYNTNTSPLNMHYGQLNMIQLWYIMFLKHI